MVEAYLELSFQRMILSAQYLSLKCDDLMDRSDHSLFSWLLRVSSCTFDGVMLVFSDELRIGFVSIEMTHIGTILGFIRCVVYLENMSLVIFT